MPNRCASLERWKASKSVTFGPYGAIQGATWHPVGADDPIVRTVCEAGAR